MPGSLLLDLHLLRKSRVTLVLTSASTSGLNKVTVFDLTADGRSVSPFSFQVACRSASEISVSNVAVSVSVTSTLYSGRMTLMSRSAEFKETSEETAGDQRQPGSCCCEMDRRCADRQPEDARS